MKTSRLIPCFLAFILLLSPYGAAMESQDRMDKVQENNLSEADRYYGLAKKSERLAKEYAAKADSFREEAEIRFRYAKRRLDEGDEKGYLKEMHLYRDYLNRETEYRTLEKKERRLAKKYRDIAKDYENR